MEEDRLALLEREKRRTREPELSWARVHSTICWCATKKFKYTITRSYKSHSNGKYTLYIEKIKDRYWKHQTKHGKQAKAKQAAHEHWRENGYE